MLLFLAGWICHPTLANVLAIGSWGHSLWAAAASAIEQLVGLARLAWRGIRGDWRRTAIRDRGAGLVGITPFFITVHILLGGATEERLASYEARDIGGERRLGYLLEVAKLLVWRMNPLASHSAHQEVWQLSQGALSTGLWRPPLAGESLARRRALGSWWRRRP